MLRAATNGSLLQMRTLLQALVLVIVVAALGYVVARVSSGWADWVVLGVIIFTVLGAARAIYTRQYPTKKRTFIRTSGPGPSA
jgi:ABC-type iron transport system FetAB permease component